jgi:hypothetical protein
VESIFNFKALTNFFVRENISEQTSSKNVSIGIIWYIKFDVSLKQFTTMKFSFTQKVTLFVLLLSANCSTLPKIQVSVEIIAVL